MMSSGAIVSLSVLVGCGGSADDASASATPGSPRASASESVESPSASPSASTSPSAKIPGQRVAAADLPVVVTNRTFSGTFQGERYYEFYAADGTLRGESGGESYTGSWEVVGDELCFTYPDDAGGPDEVDCYAVYRQGQDITWVDGDGQIITTTFQEGNPRGL